MNSTHIISGTTYFHEGHDPDNGWFRMLGKNEFRSAGYQFKIPQAGWINGCCAPCSYGERRDPNYDYRIPCARPASTPKPTAAIPQSPGEAAYQAHRLCSDVLAWGMLAPARKAGWEEIAAAARGYIDPDGTLDKLHSGKVFRHIVWVVDPLAPTACPPYVGADILRDIQAAKTAILARTGINAGPAPKASPKYVQFIPVGGADKPDGAEFGISSLNAINWFPESCDPPLSRYAESDVEAATRSVNPIFCRMPVSGPGPYELSATPVLRGRVPTGCCFRSGDSSPKLRISCGTFDVNHVSAWKAGYTKFCVPLQIVPEAHSVPVAAPKPGYVGFVPVAGADVPKGTQWRFEDGKVWLEDTSGDRFSSVSASGKYQYRRPVVGGQDATRLFVTPVAGVAVPRGCYVAHKRQPPVFPYTRGSFTCMDVGEYKDGVVQFWVHTKTYSLSPESDPVEPLIFEYSKASGTWCAPAWDSCIACEAVIFPRHAATTPWEIRGDGWSCRGTAAGLSAAKAACQVKYAELLKGCVRCS